jgi:hypothetical protein
MGIVDIVWMALILGGAGYLLYRSFWKKKGHCGNCSGGDCSSKR